IVYLADLQPQPVEWLWQHRLAAGTLAMLSGEPGSGKTWVALAVAAALTRGRDPFTGETLKPATVLYASAEHAAAQVIQPRFAGLHGDPARLVVLRRAVSVRSMSSPDCALRDLPNALPNDLNDALQKTQAHLVILDPWDGLLGQEIDLDRASQARPLLDRLGRLAELHRCCILLIRHLAKPTAGRPVHRGRASMECSAALRTEFLVGSSPDAPAQTALLHVKSNLGPLAPPLDYRIGEDGNFYWTGLSNLTSEDLLAPRPTGAGLPKRKFAAQWLRDRAKFDIGVRSSKDGKSGAWWWTLPPPEEARCSNNYLSTLSIFMKQTTYLATLPNQVRKLGKSHRIAAMAMYGAARVSRDHSPLVAVADTINPRSLSMGMMLGSRPSQALYIPAGSSVLPRESTMCRRRSPLGLVKPPLSRNH
ncbi:MAG: hypothetical protein QOJ42_570, partial [Acidobacteriaceae bacterium]|nr:hypothetical protein [Acidobacteriaceae bacterium]